MGVATGDPGPTERCNKSSGSSSLPNKKRPEPPFSQEPCLTNTRPLTLDMGVHVEAHISFRSTKLDPNPLLTSGLPGERSGSVARRVGDAGGWLSQGEGRLAAQFSAVPVTTFQKFLFFRVCGWRLGGSEFCRRRG